MKHVVCFSGGHSSALAAIEVARRYGADNLVLLNHDIDARVEHPDIKRFKGEVAAYIGLPITFANIANKSVVDVDQFDVCLASKGFSGGGHMICTSRLKTQPFMNWLKKNVPDKNAIIYYGFDASEVARVQRRSSIMAAQGYKTDYPLLWKERTIQSTQEIGITPPLTYCRFKHANCIACLKAGWQHWYIVFCNYRELWQKAKQTEDEIGYAIHKDADGNPFFLEDMEERFEKMKRAGIPATEKVTSAAFWASAKKVDSGELLFELEDNMPCECMK